MPTGVRGRRASRACRACRTRGLPRGGALGGSTPPPGIARRAARRPCRAASWPAVCYPLVAVGPAASATSSNLQTLVASRSWAASVQPRGVGRTQRTREPKGQGRRRAGLKDGALFQVLIGLYLLEASFLPSDGEPRPQEKRKKNEAICVPSKFRFTV